MSAHPLDQPRIIFHTTRPGGCLRPAVLALAEVDTLADVHIGYLRRLDGSNAIVQPRQSTAGGFVACWSCGGTIEFDDLRQMIRGRSYPPPNVEYLRGAMEVAQVRGGVVA